MGTNDSFAFWAGRLSAALEGVLDHPQGDVAASVARSTLREFDEFLAEPDRVPA